MIKKTHLHYVAITCLVLLSPHLLNSPFFDEHTLAFVAVLVLAACNRHTLNILFFINILYGLYGIVGITYGYPSLPFFASLLDTDKVESLEFIQNLPAMNWLLVTTFMVCNFIYYRTAAPKVLSKYKLSLVMLLFTVALLASWDGKYLRKAIKLPAEYAEHKAILDNSLTQQDSWEFSTNSQFRRYKNYVLVIGESLRKDYLSVYGYPHPTTPFLSQANGTFMDNAHSMSAYTGASLTRTLQLCRSMPCKETVPENNIVTLANKTGLKTFWVSNQGKLSRHDSATSVVALRAQQTHFIKKSGFFVNNTDDMELLTQAKKILKQTRNNNKSNLIVLHMQGSHPDVCERLQNFNIEFHLPYGRPVNCYLATASKTDFFLKQLTASLQAMGESYSLVYFADHGLSVTPSDVRHNQDIKNNYQVPFFVLNSDDTTQRHIKQTYSNGHFLDLFASWLGVTTNHTDPKYNMFQLDQLPIDSKLSVYYDGQMIDLNRLSSENILQ
ncbi:MAG: hypothetical protein CR974_00975 [Gammaproteobacteria bacterium]|nr:MAG: hypothetical protein CR974_00975 [Gammaproteobacteria bacterium]